MINVSETAASKITGTAGGRKQGRKRPACVRAGRRLFRFPIRADDRRERRRARAIRCTSRTASSCSWIRSACNTLKNAEVDFRRHGHRRRFHHQEPERHVHLRLRVVLHDE